METQPKYPDYIAASLEQLQHSASKFAHKSALPKKRVHTLLTGKHPSTLRGRGLQFEEVRNYVKGDDIRLIDWKVTARTGKTHAKVYSEEKERPALVIADLSSHMFYGSVKYVKSVICAHLASIIATGIHQRGDRVGTLIFGDEEHDFLPPKNSQKHIFKAMGLLAKYTQKLPSTQVIKRDPMLIEEQIHKAAQTVNHDYTVFLITDVMTLTEKATQALEQMALHNDVLVLHLEDPIDQNIPDKSLLSDGDLQIATEEEELEKYAARYQKKLASIKKRLLNHRIPSREFSTDLLPGDQIANVLNPIVR